jgi:hypothetical protein
MVRELLAVTAVIAATLLGSTVPAFGLTGPVLLGFAESYSAPDTSACTHRGVDVGISGGATADSPAAGTVRFAGRVPGPHGGSVLAVTLETPDGTVTMLPFESLDVREGEFLEKGANVGRVANSGDPSSTAPHVHLGLKRGGVYVDPVSLLAVAPPVSEPEPEPAAAPTPATTPVNVSAPAVAPQPSAAPAASTTKQPSGRTASDSVSALSSEPTRQESGVSEPVGELAPGVTLVQSPADAVSYGRSARTAYASNPVSAGAAERPASHGFTLSGNQIATAIGLTAATLFISALIVTRRALVRRVARQRPVSDRFGILLQHLKAGDTLCGLTSCPGPLPSQSRGH